MLSRASLFAALGALTLIGHAFDSPTAAGARPVKQVRYVMGTLCEITAYPPPADDAAHQMGGRASIQLTGSIPQGAADEAIAASFAELKRIDAVLSNWKTDSELMRMNMRATAEGTPRPRVKVSDELFQRLTVAFRIARETDGVFDPTVGPLVRAWGFLPSCMPGATCLDRSREQAVAEAQRRVGWQKVSLDEQRKEVWFAVPGMEIDLGGIAKGYAVERAAEILRAHGVRSALINLGRSSLKALGEAADNADLQTMSEKTNTCPGWPISISDPRDRSRDAAEICLHDGEALATSGTYEHTVGIGNGRKSHLINPHTGQALGGKMSVTVITSDAEVADALTKPFILRHELAAADAKRILGNYPGSGVVLLLVKNGRLLHRTAGKELEVRPRK